ncbi:MAG: LemA family protein [Hyphomonadaceae bacterium]
MSAFWIILIIVAVLAFLLIGIYNNLVALRQRTNQAFGDIDVQLKQRHDLVPNLVETVKGYAAHERGTLEAVIAARQGAVDAEKTGNPAAMAQAEGVLGATLGRLFALAEAYPNLKADANFQQLQAELSNLEDKIAAARRFFNNAVQEYNTGREQFPAVLFAGALGFGAREFFDLGEDRAKAEEAPKVSFS